MRWNDRIGRRIKLSDLHIFLAVAQSGSMAKAASQLAVSHPVVSRSIGELEHTLGVRLLERNPRGIELTAYGRALLNRSHAAFDELRQGVKDIEFLSDPTVGEVRIGTTPPLAASFVFAVIDRLSRRYPRIVFRVIAEGANQPGQRENLDERAVDLLVFRKVATVIDEQASFEFLFESPYVVAAGASSPWVRRRRIALAELLNEAWTLPAPDDAFGSFVDRRLSGWRARLSSRHRVDLRARNTSQSVADGPLSLGDPRVLAAASPPAPIPQEGAGRIADRQRADRYRYAEEP